MNFKKPFKNHLNYLQLTNSNDHNGISQLNYTSIIVRPHALGHVLLFHIVFDMPVPTF